VDNDSNTSSGMSFSCEDSIAFVEESETVGFAIVDLEGRWICVNQAYCKILNATWRQIIGTTFQEWTHEKDLAPDLEAAKELAEGRAMSYGIVKTYVQRGSTAKHRREITGLLEVTAVWKDGKCHRYRVKFSPYGQTDQPPTIGAEILKLLPLAVSNWKTIGGVILVVVGSIFGGSELVTRILSVIQQLQDGSGSQSSP